MLRFVLRRLFSSCILVFIVLTIMFFIAKLAPGDPLNQYYRPGTDPSLTRHLRHQFGLDSSLPVQYARWLANFVRGEFGRSFVENRPVSDILKETLPRTLQLTVFALALEVVLGLLLGMFMAAKRGTVMEKGLKITFLVFYSLPNFYLAYILITLFSIKLRILPSANMFSLHLEASGFFAVLTDRIMHMFMPVFVLAFGGAAALARFTRGSVLDVVGEDFIMAARAKGLSERRVLWVHALKNALPTVLTVVGLSFPFILGGAVVVEKIFAWPGMGALAVDAIFSRDYPVILATGFIGAVMVVVGDFLADVSYAFFDPRIKVPGGREA